MKPNGVDIVGDLSTLIKGASERRKPGDLSEV